MEEMGRKLAEATEAAGEMKKLARAFGMFSPWENRRQHRSNRE
jgi:hypothetical protein